MTFFSAIGLAVCLIGVIGAGPAFARDTSIRGQIQQTSTRAYRIDEAGRFFVGDRVDVVYDAQDPSGIVPDWPGA